jgi:hypothetical protein
MPQRIPSTVSDQYIYFTARSSLGVLLTGLTSFTVYRARNGGAATAYTTPTVAEVSAANMPGVYSLLIDEDTTITTGDSVNMIALYITQASMVPVIEIVELYRLVVSAGQTLTVTSSNINALNANTITAASIASDAITAAKIAADAIGASEIAADAITEIQAGLATAASIAALNNLSQDNVRTAVGLASANLDTQLASISTDTTTDIPAQISALNNLSSADVTAAVPSAADNADAVWADVIESGYTAAEILRLLAAYAAGNATGLDSTAAFVGLDGTTTRIQGTIAGPTRTITGLDGV